MPKVRTKQKLIYKETQAVLHFAGFPVGKGFRMHNSLSSFALYDMLTYATGLKKTGQLYRLGFDKKLVITESENGVGVLKLVNVRMFIVCLDHGIRNWFRKNTRVQLDTARMRKVRTIMEHFKQSQQMYYKNKKGYLNFQGLKVAVRGDKMHAGALMQVLLKNSGGNGSNITMASAQDFFRNPETLQTLDIQAFAAYKSELWIWHLDAEKMIKNFSKLNGKTLAPDIQASMLQNLQQLQKPPKNS